MKTVLWRTARTGIQQVRLLQIIGTYQGRSDFNGPIFQRIQKNECAVENLIN
jgi:hypothetical protein